MTKLSFLNKILDLLRVLGTLSLQCIMTTNPVQGHCYVRYEFQLRMLGLLTAVAVSPLESDGNVSKLQTPQSEKWPCISKRGVRSN